MFDEYEKRVLRKVKNKKIFERKVKGFGMFQN